MTTGRINQVAAFRERRPWKRARPDGTRPELSSVVTPSLARKGWSEERAIVFRIAAPIIRLRPKMVAAANGTLAANPVRKPSPAKRRRSGGLRS